jgi:tRNA-binding protein
VSEVPFEQFAEVDIRVGTVTAVEEFPDARKPAWKLAIDFGPEVGVKRCSAQITHYPLDDLEGRQVVAVVNFPPRRIGPFLSEVLVLGALDDEQGRRPAAPRLPRRGRRPDRLAQPRRAKGAVA